MRRRDFIAAIAGPAFAWSVAARAQQRDRMRRIGVLMARSESEPLFQGWIQSFRDGLGRLGWTEGDNVRIDYRWTAAVPDRFRTAALELVALRPDVILADATPSVAALRRETETVPIVFVTVTDPVSQGFVASLARPGGHITGFTNLEFAIGGKWLSLLKEIAPDIRRVALMFNPTTAPYADSFVRIIKSAASSYQLVTIRMAVRSIGEIEAAIVRFAGESKGGLMLVSDSFMTANGQRIFALAAEHGLPAISDLLVQTRRGGLIAYGPDTFDIFRRAAFYVDRILKGESPSELPVQAPIKFVLVVNLKTAKALGLEVPSTLLATANEVIE
jgi:putative ABC transport system substrate-binding protein